MNNFIKLSLFLFGIILITSCAKNSNTATIKISSYGQQHDSIWINLFPYDKPESSFIKLKLNNGVVILDTLIKTPYFGIVMFPSTLDNGKLDYIYSDNIEFKIDPEEKVQINATFKKEGFNYFIEDNSFNRQLKKYNTAIAHENNKINGIYREILNRYPNEDDWTLPGIDSLLRQRESPRDSIEKKKEKFIQANLENEIAAYLMYYYPKEKVQKLFPLLNDKAKSSTYGKLIEKKLNYWASIEIGASAPNFHYKSIDNEQISLDRLKGKYVLLDFWGTWCQPCIKDIPDLKMFYNAHHDYLEIIGIACYDNYDSWKNLTTDKEMKWIQIFNDPQNQDLTKTYDISVFPSKILIDPNGKIIKTIKDSGKETFNQLDELINSRYMN